MRRGAFLIGLIFTFSSSIQSQSISSVTEIKADKLFAGKAYDKAAKLYSRLSEQSSDYRITLKLARAYYELEEPQLSYLQYKQVIDKTYLVNSSDFLRYASVLKEIEKPEAAKHWVRRYLSINPRSELAQNLLYELQSSNESYRADLLKLQHNQETPTIQATLLVVNSISSSRSYVITDQKVIEAMKQAHNPNIDWLKRLLRENNFEISNTININPVLFNSDQVVMEPSYQQELDKLAKLMKQYPHIEFEIRAHADTSGSTTYNQKLSQSRANAARDFLLTKEIHIERLLAIGYGENDPIFQCDDLPCDKEEARLNRRMEFRLVHLNHHQIVSN